MAIAKIKHPEAVINDRLNSTGTPLTFLARETGLSLNKVYRGLGRSKGKRRGYMRADEFILYCVALGLTLNDFTAREGERNNASSTDSA